MYLHRACIISKWAKLISEPVRKIPANHFSLRFADCWTWNISRRQSCFDKVWMDPRQGSDGVLPARHVLKPVCLVSCQLTFWLLGSSPASLFWSQRPNASRACYPVADSQEAWLGVWALFPLWRISGCSSFHSKPEWNHILKYLNPPRNRLAFLYAFLIAILLIWRKINMLIIGTISITRPLGCTNSFCWWFLGHSNFQSN